MADPERHVELAAWLRLERTPGIGITTAHKLLRQFGLPENIFSASHARLCEVAGQRAANALLAPPDAALHALIDRTTAWDAADGQTVLTLADPAYPADLLDIPDPPLMLYAKGRIELLQTPAVAVVGSRNATSQGMLNAEHFSRALSQSGLTIISGLALGIDSAAHRGALDGAGSTIAVIGTGADIIYPARNRDLAQAICARGCVLSEYPLGTPALAANFPRRNRIISGLAQGVLVVEAAARSGSLITARMAAEQGRDVFAIPGSIHSPLAKGCHLLIRQGAKLVECAQDVLEELRMTSRSRASTTMQPPVPDACHPDTARMLDALGHDPVAPDELSARWQLDMAEVQARLLELELNGMIETLPGGKVCRLATR